MKRITVLILAAMLLAGCGAVEDGAPQTKAAAATEQTSQSEKNAPEETQTFVMTTVLGTSVSNGASPEEKAIESAKKTTTRIPLNTDIVEYTTSQENTAGEMSDTASIFPEGFLDTVTLAEYRDFDEKRYVIEGEKLNEVKMTFSAFAGKKCEDPGIDGGYMFVLNDNTGGEYYLFFTLNYICFNGQYYVMDTFDAGENMAAFFRAERTNCVDAEDMTAEFELVMLRPGGKSGYVVHDTYGLTSFSLQEGSLEDMPAGTMLKITWSGRIAEIYPSVLEGVSSVTRANNLANPDRPDFVTENLPALIEACRGKEDYSAEIDKLTGLKKCEKDALMWLVGNELTT